MPESVHDEGIWARNEDLAEEANSKSILKW